MPRLLIILLLLPCIAVTQTATVAINQPAIRFEVPEILQKAGVRSVRCIFKDSRGLMWFGTENGLYRFDGTHVVYKRKNAGAQHTFPDNTIVNIAEDSTGHLWIATLHGVARMNPYNFQCEEYSYANKLMQGDYDFKMHIDNNGNVWAGHSKGLAVFNASLNRFDEVLDKSSDTYVTCMSDYDHDKLAVGTFKGVFFIDKKNYACTLVKEQANAPVTALLLDSQKKLWAGTWGSGVYFYDAQQQQFVREEIRIAEIVLGIAETRTQRGFDLWVAGSGGLVRLSFANEKAKPDAISIYRRNEKEGSFPVQSGGRLGLGANGSIWMAGEAEINLVKFNPDAPFFNTMPIALKGAVYDIQSFQLKNKRYYCVSSWYNETGMTITDEKWKVIRQFAHVPQNSAEAARNVAGIAVDKFDRIWVSTLDGLTVLDDNFKVIKNWSSADKHADKLTKPKTNAVIIRSDTVWVACYNSGIDIYDLNFKKLHHFSEADGSGLKEQLTWKFFCDSNNDLWICGNSLLYRFNSNNNNFTSYSLSPDKSVAGCAPRDIAQLQANNLLVASDHGLIHFNTKTGAYKYIRSPLLENEDKVISVSIDANGNAWYLTAEQLVLYEPKREQFTLFGAEDGLRAGRGMHIVRSFKNDEVIIGQNEQLLQFNYRNAGNRTAAPKLMLTSLQVNDSNWLFSKPVRNLQLQHFQNKLYIEFTGINYEKAAQNQYAVLLEGIDKDWVITSRDFASYANLGHGNYKFRVKASDYAGNWSDEYVMDINILPPFWLTWWFISIAVLVLGSIFFLVVRYISQRNLRERILLLEKEQAVEKERTRIASDMHDDLGSGLTKIAILSEVAKKQLAEPEKAVRQLENISSSSRELVDNLQDIIWVLNPRNDSLDNLAAYIREYALKFFEPLNVQLFFEYPVNIPAMKLSEEMRRNIFLVMKETFNNIAKHAQGRNIKVKLIAGENNVEIVVCDDGKGFEASRIPAFSNGLNNMNNRMKQIGGLYEFNSQPGKGTTTRLVVTA